MSSETPILARLLSSNAQWAADVDKAEPGFFENSSKGQSPKVLWIGCADSRVPESVLMGCRPGEIFVHRNIANQFHPDDDSAQAVLTYAVQNLGVEHVIVVGHTQCGGVAGAYGAACENAAHAASKHDPPQETASTPLGRWLAPLITLASSLRLSSAPPAEALPLLVEESVKQQVANICKSSVITNSWAGGTKQSVTVHGWVYELETGRLRDLDVSAGP